MVSPKQADIFSTDVQNVEPLYPCMLRTHMIQALFSVGNVVIHINLSPIWRNTRYVIKTVEKDFATTNYVILSILHKIKSQLLSVDKNYIFILYTILETHADI